MGTIEFCIVSLGSSVPAPSLAGLALALLDLVTLSLLRFFYLLFILEPLL